MSSRSVSKNVVPLENIHRKLSSSKNINSLFAEFEQQKLFEPYDESLELQSMMGKDDNVSSKFNKSHLEIKEEVFSQISHKDEWITPKKNTRGEIKIGNFTVSEL